MQQFVAIFQPQSAGEGKLRGVNKVYRTHRVVPCLAVLILYRTEHRCNDIIHCNEPCHAAVFIYNDCDILHIGIHRSNDRKDGRTLGNKNRRTLQSLKFRRPPLLQSKQQRLIMDDAGNGIGFGIVDWQA